MYCLVDDFYYRYSTYTSETLQQISLEKGTLPFCDKIETVYYNKSISGEWGNHIFLIPHLFPNCREVNLQSFTFSSRGDFEKFFSLPFHSIELSCYDQPDSLFDTLNIKNSALKILQLHKIGKVKNVEVDCQNLQELRLSEIYGEEMEMRESLLENIIADLIQKDKKKALKLKELCLTRVLPDQFEENGSSNIELKPHSPQHIFIPSTSFPLLKKLELESFLNTISLELESDSIRQIRLEDFPFLKRVDIKSNSLLAFELKTVCKVDVVKVEAENMCQLELDRAPFIHQIDIKSSKLVHYQHGTLCTQDSLIHSLSNCPNVRFFEIGKFHRNAKLRVSVRKLLREIPRVCPKIALVKIHKHLFGVREQTLKHLQQEFESTNRKVEIQAPISLQAIEESGENSVKADVVNKWQKKTLFKLFNSWRVFSNLVNLKGVFSMARPRKRLEWEHLNFKN